MTPDTRRRPLIPRRDLAPSVLSEAIADVIDDMVRMRIVDVTPSTVDAIAAGVARALQPVYLGCTRGAHRETRETHTLTVSAEVDQ
jgi:hypothetical protein